MDNFTINHTLSLLVLLFFLTHLTTTSGSNTSGLVPVGATEYRVFTGNSDGRRNLAPFQLCLLCKCCTRGDHSTCTSIPCCFGIDCQLPNKPFGVCAFVPKTCNCTNCAT